MRKQTKNKSTVEGGNVFVRRTKRTMEERFCTVLQRPKNDSQLVPERADAVHQPSDPIPGGAFLVLQPPPGRLLRVELLLQGLLALLQLLVPRLMLGVALQQPLAQRLICASVRSYFCVGF